jgi:hypothetical protein
LIAYANSAAGGIESALKEAQKARLDDVDQWLAKRYGPKRAASFQHAHMLEEGRPVETVWDAMTAITAHAKTIAYTADRVEVEAEAGALLKLVA